MSSSEYMLAKTKNSLKEDEDVICDQFSNGIRPGTGSTQPREDGA